MVGLGGGGGAFFGRILPDMLSVRPERGEVGGSGEGEGGRGGFEIGLMRPLFDSLGEARVSSLSNTGCASAPRSPVGSDMGEVRT